MKPTLLLLALLISAALSGCATSGTQSTKPDRSDLSMRNKAATQAYVTACDRLFLSAAKRAEQAMTVASRNDEMITTCDSILAVGASPNADAKIISVYRDTATAARAYFLARPDWRSNTVTVVLAAAAGALDAVAGGGVATLTVVGAETKGAARRATIATDLEKAVKRWQEISRASGYQSDFWNRIASI